MAGDYLKETLLSDLPSIFYIAYSKTLSNDVRCIRLEIHVQGPLPFVLISIKMLKAVNTIGNYLTYY